LRHALQQVDWQLSGPYSFITRQGLDIQLDVNPPAEVEKCLARDFEHRVDRLCQQKWPEHTPPLDWPRLRSLLRRKQWAPTAKKVLLQLLPHFLPTRSWLHARGHPLAPTCPCGQLDDLAHRLGGCTYLGEGVPYTAAQVQQALLRLPRPEAPEPAGIQRAINGDSVPPQQIRWDPDRPVFTDGSCKYVDAQTWHRLGQPPSNMPRMGGS
jgi:hypothetical protein